MAAPTSVGDMRGGDGNGRGLWDPGRESSDAIGFLQNKTMIMTSSLIFVHTVNIHMYSIMHARDLCMINCLHYLIALEMMPNNLIIITHRPCVAAELLGVP